MFIPLKDDNPLRVIRFQFVTAFLIVLNTLIYLFTGALAGSEASIAFDVSYGVIPAELLNPGNGTLPAISPLAEMATLITYQFLHGSWFHLLSNMAFLWVFADNIEDAFGYAGFALFYLLCGIAAALTHVMMSADSTVPLIGASGAVSGIMGAYILLYPRARMFVLFFLPIPFRIPAYVVLGFWIVLQVLNAVAVGSGASEVAFWAHVGGFAAGLVLTLLLRSRLLVKA